MSKKEIAFSVALWTLSPQEKFNAIKAAKCTQAVSIYNSTISKVTFAVYLKRYSDLSIYISEKNVELGRHFAVCLAESLPTTLLLKLNQYI